MHGLVHVGTAGPLDHCDIGQGQADQPAILLEDREVPDEGVPEEGGLDVLGIHVLAARRHEHLIGPTRDEEEAARVQISEIARPKPAVPGEGLASLVGHVQVLA